jgi:hypothetical protein
MSDTMVPTRVPELTADMVVVQYVQKEDVKSSVKGQSPLERTSNAVVIKLNHFVTEFLNAAWHIHECLGYYTRPLIVTTYFIVKLRGVTPIPGNTSGF